jgi:mono/diheme cytochrome c family protein
MVNKSWRIAGCLAIATMLIAGRNTCAAFQLTADPAFPQRATAKNSPVTPVVGESWLSHLNRSLGDTSMGKTWQLGPPPSAPEDATSRWQAAVLVGCTTQSATLRGADLYRLNCRGCHGEGGLGAPPEITSVIDPVRATSVQLVRQRMKNVGMDVSQAQAMQLAQQAQAALVQRLHTGGKNMPPFPQLSETEIRSILAYLKQLAGIPGAENEQVAVSESPVRVGELIVKSTCHICHSATGPNASPEQLLNGAIPALETLTTRKDQSGLVEKVTQGSPVLMGEPPTLSRGRMPVFHYLTPDEAADVYLYLTLYPPSELAILEPAATTPQQDRTPSVIHHTEPALGSQAGSNNDGPEIPHLSSRAATQILALFVGLGVLAAALGAGGIGFTLWEFKRLASKNERCALAARDARVNPEVVRPVIVLKQTPCRTHSGRNKERRPEPPCAEGGDLARKNYRGERRCHGARFA